MHLIATDPPFNKNRDFHATPDSLAKGARFSDRWSWHRDVHEEWVDAIKDDWPNAWLVIQAARSSFGDDMGAFLCWLGVRLMEMRRVLRDDGSIYLHIDHTAHAYVKALMDAIFGKRNFRNEIVWAYRTGGVSKRYWPRKHDSLLFYVKTDSYVHNPIQERVYYEKPFFTDEMDDKGRYFADVYVRDVWDDVKPLINVSRERMGYPTQKPLALYERIIKASSNPSDIVLDPFCGCATTPIAAERLGRQWIGMDIWEGAHDMVLKRLQKEGLASPRATSDRLITFGDVTYSKVPPIRNDDKEIAAPGFKLKIQRPVERWEKITHKEMTNILIQVQGTSDGVICAGCGRVLEKEFMELDHITPKSDRGENHIMNRILLCGPCNRRKRDNLTLRGLMRENKKSDVGWMRDEKRAKMAQGKAADRAEWVRDNCGTLECNALMQGQLT